MSGPKSWSCKPTGSAPNLSFKLSLQIASFSDLSVKCIHSFRPPATLFWTLLCNQHQTTTEWGASVAESTGNVASSCEIFQRERKSAGAVDVMRGDAQTHLESWGPHKSLIAAWLTASPGLQTLSCSCSGKPPFINLISLTLTEEKGKSKQHLLCLIPGHKAVVFLLLFLPFVCEKKTKNLGGEPGLMCWPLSSSRHV